MAPFLYTILNNKEKQRVKDYIILYGDSDSYYLCKANSIKEAIISFADYCGYSQSILKEAMQRLWETNGMIEMFNLFCTHNDLKIVNVGEIVLFGGKT